MISLFNEDHIFLKMPINNLHILLISTMSLTAQTHYKQEIDKDIHQIQALISLNIDLHIIDSIKMSIV